MKIFYEGRVALVTVATSGLGLAAAIGYAKAGDYPQPDQIRLWVTKQLNYPTARTT